MEMQKFLNEDAQGSKVVIPVIRLSSGLYMIGQLKYSVEMADSDYDEYDDEEDYGQECDREV